MSDSRESSIIKVLSDQGKRAVGVGVLIGKKWVLTCRHVVEAALPSAKIGDKIYLIFFRHESDEPIESYVNFLAKKEEPDFAILELKDEAPQYASIAKLVTKNFKGRELEACGFPSGADGIWVQLNALGYADSFSVQIDIISKSGYKIIGGFSGTPVFDAKLDDVFGIVVTGDSDEEKFSGCFTTVELILDVCKKYPTVLKAFESLDGPHGPIIGVPTLPPHYLPRTEHLEKIKELVLADDVKPTITASAKITALQGMGGTGKSVLAAAFARTIENRRAFNDGILWVTVGSENPDLIGNMRLVGTAFGDDPANYSSQKQAEASLTKVLSDKVSLIVLDDIWKVPHVTPFVNALGPRCRLLITTRNEDVVISLGAQECKIEMFGEPEALKLMADWSEQEINSLSSEANGVAKECGYLPLALSMCGAMAKCGRSWSGILKALQKAKLESITAYLPNNQYSNVMKALEISVDFLENECLEAVQRYKELVIFHADKYVPEVTIATLWAYTWNLEDWEVEELLIKLKNRSLLRLDGKAPNRLISLHDLQIDYLIAKTKAEKIDLSCLHNQLIEAYGKKCGNKWSTGSEDGYFFEHLAYHMKEAGKQEELRKLLLDFEWMCSKLNKVYTIQKETGVKRPDVNSLIHDYDYLPNDKEIEFVQGAIELSSNVILKDKTQLAGQLMGRLLCFPDNGIQLLLSQACECKDGIRLLPKTPSLEPPGGPLIRTLEGHGYSVNAVAITPDRKYAVSGSDEATLTVWDLEKGEEKTTLKGYHGSVNAVAITPDGKYAVSGSDDQTLKVWDLKRGEEKAILRGHKGNVNTVAITPDGKYAISGSDDATLKVWDLEKGEEKTTLKGHSDRVNAIAITPDGNYAVSASNDKTLRIWDLKKEKEKTTLKEYPYFVATSVAITPDGKYAVSGSNDWTLKIWDLEKGEEKTTLKGHKSSVNAVAITPDGKYVVSGSDDWTLKVWNLEKGEEKTTLKGHSWEVNAVAITSDGKFAVSASKDRTLKVWDLEEVEGTTIQEGNEKAVTAVAITPDGKDIVSALANGKLKVWNLEKREEKTTLKGQSYRMKAIAVTPDGKYAVSASKDWTLKIWDLEKGEEKTTLKGHKDSVNAVAITPDGNYAVSASHDKTLKIWGLEKGEEKATMEGHTARVNAVAITPDGKYAVSASHDKTLKIWDLEKREEKATMEGHDNPVSAVAITIDGKYAVSASWDGKLKVWNLENGKEKKTLEGHNDRVNAVAITPDGKYAVSASMDKTLKIWDLKEGAIISNFTGNSSFLNCDISLDSEYIVAGDILGKMHFLYLDRPN